MLIGYYQKYGPSITLTKRSNNKLRITKIIPSACALSAAATTFFLNVLLIFYVSEIAFLLVRSFCSYTDYHCI